MKNLRKCKYFGFIALVITLANPVLAAAKELDLPALTAEVSSKVKEIFQTSTLEAVGGTISQKIENQKIINDTIVCIEKIKHECIQHALFTEILFLNRDLSKSYSLSKIHTTLKQFSNDQIERFKENKARNLYNDFLAAYWYATGIGIEAGYKIHNSKIGAVALIPIGIGGLVDLVKSPFVGAAHGINLLYVKSSSESVGRSIVDFISDSAKKGAILDISDKERYGEFYLSIIGSETGSNSPEKQIYEIHNNFFSVSDYHTYLRLLENK